MGEANGWSKPFITDFINLYKKNPCLWQRDNKFYNNKNMRDKACDKLVSFCKQVFPYADRDFVMKKIHAFRGTFRKEYNKVQETSRKGSKAYIPKLWYYKLLLFVVDQDKPKVNHVKKRSLRNPPTKSLGIIKQEPVDPGYADMDEGVDSEEEEEEPEQEPFMNSQLLDMFCEKRVGSPSSAGPLNGSFTNNSASKNRISTIFTDSQNLNMQTGCSCKRRDIDEFEALGISVSNKLRRMDAFQAICAEFLINTVLNRGLLKTLLPSTVLCEDHCNLR